jgi:hypothetical protein
MHMDMDIDTDRESVADTAIDKDPHRHASIVVSLVSGTTGHGLVR